MQNRTMSRGYLIAGMMAFACGCGPSTAEFAPIGNETPTQVQIANVCTLQQRNLQAYEAGVSALLAKLGDAGDDAAAIPPFVASETYDAATCQEAYDTVESGTYTGP